MKVLVIALDTVTPAGLPHGDVLVVAPATTSRLRRWLSDDDVARRRARERVDAFVQQLERRGIRADGRIGDGDPMQAIADALVTFAADEIVVAAAPGRSTELADEVAAQARRRFALRTFLAGEALPLAA
jgi:hypothetical protein